MAQSTESVNTTDVSRCKFGITSISQNFLDIPGFPRLLGKFLKSQVDPQIPKILGKFSSSGSAAPTIARVIYFTHASSLDRTAVAALRWQYMAYRDIKPTLTVTLTGVFSCLRRRGMR